MRVVIVGYGEMLEALVAGVMDSKHDLTGVFRHENVLYNRLKRLFYDYTLPSGDFHLVKNLYIYDIIAPSVNSKKFIKEIKRLKADVIIVGSWSEKFSLKTINAPNIACINVHPSLLPEYRGPNPYFRTILNGADKTGVTFHLMTEKYDAGNILKQIEIPISSDETGKSLRFKCTNVVKNNIAELLDNLADEIRNSRPQQENLATYQKQITLAESILDFKNETSIQIDRRIRALTPWLKCFINHKNEFFSFKQYKLTDQQSEKPPGTIAGKKGNSLSFVCKDKRIMEFEDLSICRPFSKLWTKLYINYCIKTDL